ncbi:MAG: NADH-quinone oxidoreductase subunit A [Pseudomonadota bacterium]
MLFNLANILVFLGLAAALILALLIVGGIFRPKTPDQTKILIYECGERPIGQAWFNFNPRFYIVALVFLIFDVEIAFTFPVVTTLRSWVQAGAGSVAIVELLVFLAILAFGLAYVWCKGDLEWIRQAANAKGTGASAGSDSKSGTGGANDSPASSTASELDKAAREKAA